MTDDGEPSEASKALPDGKKPEKKKGSASSMIIGASDPEPGAVAAAAKAAAAAEAKAAKAAKEAEGMAFITKRGDLEEADVNSVLGYPIDTFQQGCLKVIVKPDVDLLAPKLAFLERLADRICQRAISTNRRSVVVVA